MDDVEIGQARLNHQDVRPLALIQLGLGDRFSAIGRIHLVAGFVFRDRLVGQGPRR